MTVEDDPIVRADLRLVLEDAGFGVCADARDGIEAVELARLHTPDLIVLDLGLPRLDGVEATRQILDERDVPIIALTGRSTSLAMEAMEAGAVTWLRKPFVERELVDTVTTALDNASAESARRIPCDARDDPGARRVSHGLVGRPRAPCLRGGPRLEAIALDDATVHNACSTAPALELHTGRAYSAVVAGDE